MHNVESKSNLFMHNVENKSNLFMHNVKKSPNILKKSSGINTTRFLKYIWPFSTLYMKRLTNLSALNLS